MPSASDTKGHLALPWVDLLFELCCDNSPNRHATAHYRSSGHPLIRSIEPGEEWSWCDEDELAMDISDVRGHTRIPPSPMLTR